MKKNLLFFALHFCLFSYSQNITVKPRLNNTENKSQPQYPNIVQNNSNQTLPYPIIFIHGLDSNSEVWIDLRTQLINSGLNFGGRIDFCLNDDGNNNVANKLVYPTPNADIALYTDYINDLSVGDFYFLNFDVNNIGELFPSDDGSAFNDVLSNESAIVKQGIAVKLAIQIILQKTGRDKVILMGHSMGGLASREYIQNPSNWQPDGQHHVAKLVTTGTPHGGFTGVNLSPTIDSSSEAYRDLKKNYVYGGNGVYLFGGIENYPNMLNNLLYTFYNVDVNCNGVDADNSNIIGLNYKGWITDIDYSYIVGMCDNCNSLYPGMPGDGIVKDIDANLSNFSNFLPLPINEFIYTANALNPVYGLHTDLPKAIPVSFKGLDEPNEYNLSYGINLNQTYTGFITEQPVLGYSSDYDDYKINITSNGNYTIAINNSYYNSISYRILDSSFNILSTNTILANSQSSFQHNLNTGSYYIEFISVGNLSSYNYPYTFLIQSTLSNDDNILQTGLKAFPNPFTNQLTIESKELIHKVEIFNLLGQKVKNILFNNPTENSINIELSDLAQGNYIAKVTSELSVNTVKIIKN
jgi:pimeloyl-ACP methyl ester carboxylesterase